MMKGVFLIVFLNLSYFLLSAEQKPNIIFYLADDQNVLDYGCYGNNKVTTPAVDNLAKEGMRFTQAFTGQAICAPSRNMLYTAKYPLKNGVFLNHIKTKKEIKSVTYYLKNLGYEVILAGKSHVNPSSVFDWTYHWDSEPDESKPRKVLPLDEIENYLKTTNRPFCMFVTSDFPHGPYPNITGTKKEEVKLFPYHWDSQRNLNRMKGYYENIKSDNNQLERVLQFLDESGKTNNTIFFYASDHGKDGKFTLYDRGLHVPLIVRWPGVINAGSVSNTMVHFIDVMPTLIDLIGGQPPKDFDGKSFLTVLKGKDKVIHKYVYGVQSNQNIQQCAVFPSRMIRDENFKYIRNFNSKEVVEKNLGENENVNAFILLGAEKFKDVPYEELYDIKNDPFEQVNLACNIKYKEIKKQLVEELYNWMKQQGDFLTEPGSMPLLKPTLHALDKTSKWKTVPVELENTLNDDDYLKLHY